MDSGPSPPPSVSFEEALGRAIRLAERAHADAGNPENPEVTATLAVAWATIAQAVATKYATAAAKYTAPLI